MEVFNNREIATLFWLAVVLIWGCSQKNLRKSMRSVLDALLNKKIILLIFIYYMYVGFTVFCLSRLGFWDASLSQIKSTLVWSILAGFAATFRVVEQSTTAYPVYFKKWILDNFKIAVLIQFLISLRPFSILLEIVLQPIMAFLSMINVYSEKKEEYKQVLQLSVFLLVSIVIWMFLYGILGVWEEYTKYATFKTFWDFIFPIVMSLCFTPFLYILFTYTTYERAFIGLSNVFNDQKLIRYAKFRAILSFRFDFDLLDRWRRNVLLTQPKSKEDIKRTISELKEIKAIEKKPPNVEPNEGWSPYAAQKFLEDYGIVAGDYHGQYGEWFASAPLLEIDEKALFSDNVGYYIEGDKRAVKKLTLKLNVNNPDKNIVSEELFIRIVTLLFKKTVNDPVLQPFKEMVASGKGDIKVNECVQVSVSRNEWDGGIKGGYDKTIVFTVVDVQDE